MKSSNTSIIKEQDRGDHHDPALYFLLGNIRMPTQCLIIKDNGNGKFDGICCYSEGQPNYTLTMLEAHYNTDKKVDELIATDGISRLYETVEEYSKYNVSIWEYKFDKFNDIKPKMRQHKIRYAYIWTDDKEWYPIILSE